MSTELALETLLQTFTVRGNTDNIGCGYSEMLSALGHQEGGRDTGPVSPIPGIPYSEL